MKPAFVALLIVAMTLAGCGPMVRYRPQVRLDPASQDRRAATAPRDGLLWVVYRSGRGGPWVELGNALAVVRGDPVTLRKDASGTVVADAGGFTLTLDALPPRARTVALAYRRDPAAARDPNRAGFAESAFYVVATVAIAAAVVGLVVLLLAADDDGTTVNLNSNALQ